MDKGIKKGINQAKKNLDQLGEALDRVARDPKIREKLGTHPIETLTELGFELDDEDRAELQEQRIVARTSGLAFPKFTSLVKSGVKSGVKVGVQTAATTAVKSVIKETPEGKPGPAKKLEDKSGKK